MYYIINLTKDKEDPHCTKAETYEFPLLCRVDDIISGHLTLEDKCAKNLSKEYDLLFGTYVEAIPENAIEQSVRDIIFAHPLKPVIGVFCDGKYNRLYTISMTDIAENCHLEVEGLFKECKM